MNFDKYFSNCSKEYLNLIDSSLYDEITEIIAKLPKRQKQEEINNDLFWLLIDKGWSFDTLAGISEKPPPQFKTLEMEKLGDVHKIIRIPEETGVIHKLRPGKVA